MPHNHKVLIILPEWKRTFLGNNVGQVMAALHERGAQIALYCKPSAENSFLSEDFPTAKLYDFRQTGNLCASFRSFIKVLRAFRPDVVFWTYAGYYENFLLAVLKGWGNKIPYVIKSDSRVPGQYGRGIKAFLWDRIFVQTPAVKADMILAETEDLLEGLEQYCKSGRVHIFKNGVSVRRLSSFQESFQKESNTHIRPYILYAGRIAREKGTDMLIESFKHIANRHPGWTLNLVGPEEEKEYTDMCKKMVLDAGLEGRIIFYPYASGSDLYRWFYFAEFFVLPSRKEGLANVLTEAMFFKNPVISFDVGKTNSLIDSNTGILVPPEDTVSFGEAMNRIIENGELRRKMGEKAKAQIVKEHNYDVLIPQLLEKCDNLLREAKNG